MTEENKKDTVPSSQVLGEILRVHEKLDSMRGAVDKVANEQAYTHEKLNKFEIRLDALETKERGHAETVRKAMQSAHDLEDHLKSTESGMKSAVERMSAGVNSRMDQFESHRRANDTEMATQTKLLQRVIVAQEAQRARDEEIARARKERLDETARDAAALEKKRKHQIRIYGLLASIIVAALSVAGNYVVSRAAPPPAAVDTHH